MEDGGRGRDRSRANGGERKSWTNLSESKSEEKYIHFAQLVDVEAAAHFISRSVKKHKGKGEKAKLNQKLTQRKYRNTFKVNAFIFPSHCFSTQQEMSRVEDSNI